MNSAENFLADRYIKGTRPVCGYDNAHGDQCEKNAALHQSRTAHQPWEHIKRVAAC